MKRIDMGRIKKLLSVFLIFVFIFTVSTPYATSFAIDNEVKYGLWGEYYTGTKLNTFHTAHTDSQIDFKWESAGPVSGVFENYSIRWTGRIRADYSEYYTFTTTSDDGVILKIDGERIINDVGPHGARDATGTIKLEAGKLYDIEIEYYNGAGGGQIQLYWQSNSLAKEIVPQKNLFAPVNRAEVTLSYTDSSEVITAKMLCEYDKTVILVAEKYDAAGKLVDTIKQIRSNSTTYIWEITDPLETDKDYSYKAYVTDEDGTIISDIARGKFGVDMDLDIDASQITGSVSPLLYGACIEDVNHELYGGIWSQMIFGENFAESPKASFDGFTAAGGKWYTKEVSGKNEIWIDNTAGGPKLVIDGTECTTGTVSADIYMNGEGPAGFITKVTDPKSGSDNFNGYEIGISSNNVRIGKHQYNYTFISDTPCTAPANTWVNLKVVMTADSMTVYVNNVFVTQYIDPAPLRTGAVGFRAWNSSAGFKNIKFDKDGTGERAIAIPESNPDTEVSGMWEHEFTGSAKGSMALVAGSLASNSQGNTQRVTFTSGTGTAGINNMGLNRMGMSFVAGKEYEGYFYAKTNSPVDVYAVMESADGSKQYAEKAISVSGSDFKKYSFAVTPNSTDDVGRFSIELKSAGTVDFGYVFLEPGEWGKYKGLSVRKDVGDRLEQQNLTVMRFGGCMVNNGNYRWKKMLGEPEYRANYNGWWYEYSSFGFGIIEFLNLCEALGVTAVPDFNLDETPSDMVDFISFAMGTDTNNPWVQKRIEMGHSEPYDLKYIQIGNEERVDASFATRFNNIANVIWAVNDTLTLVAGDFDYKKVITDPYHFDGAASGITTLANHKTILDNAQSKGRPVWFDVHCWSNNPSEITGYFENSASLYYALKSICPEADFKLAVFELNAWGHDFNRALGNATAIVKGENLSEIFGIICSANGLQVDGQNDNGWDQGLVFMDSDSAWYQPPAYITQMSAAYSQPYKAPYALSEKNSDITVSVTRSEDGKTVVVKVVNAADRRMNVSINIPQFKDNKTWLTTLSYSDSLNAVNTVDNPEASKPSDTQKIENALKNGSRVVSMQANSYTVLEFSAGEENMIIPGDLDNDGTATVSDVVRLRSIIMSGKTTDYDIQSGDLDKDGGLTVTDVVALRTLIIKG